MSTQTIKAEIINNVLVAMSLYIMEQQTLTILQNVMQQELVRVNMEEITTLPAERKDDISQRNQYIIQLFLVKKRDLARGTKENYLNAIRRLLTEISTKSLDQMDTTDIDWYLSRYEIRNVSSGGKKNQPSTYNNERRFLSAFFTWMRLEKLITDNPVESIPAKKVPVKPIDYYNPEESARLRDACKNIRERALLEVLRSTGARIGEIAEIALDQVDMRTGDICIQGEKSGKYRTIYLDDDARHYYGLYLDSRKDDCLYMFPRSRKPYGKMTTCGFRAILKTIRKRAELTCRVYPHKSRKTLGMNLKNRGVDIGTIQEIMGHADPGVTARYYAQSNPRTLRSVRERVNV
ncbi:tyrosine-type recombinase/integrase [Enterocloster bolteae]|uniref:tyrosine-type recombinase/integrase n=1 Tax=Enterocloster bolteae TaxID=208479 RepID=UPI0020629759|nr:MAG TPA: SITE SPECIFIC RECOMBINASE XERD [Caudoviricetes sp.]